MLAVHILASALGLIFALLPGFVFAQSGVQLYVSPPQFTKFPEITTHISIWNGGNRFIPDLPTSVFSVLENNEFLQATRVEIVQPGVQFVVAINPGTTFAIRDFQGKSRYDLMVDHLTAWAASHPDGDDLSLLLNNSPGVQHSTDPAFWLNVLEEAPSDHRNATPNWQILSLAVGLAADPPPSPGMGRGVLLITQNPEADALPIFENITYLAQQSGVRIYVWMVSSPGFFDSQGAQALRLMTQQTGGQFFPFSGVEELPSVDSYFEDLGSTYRLTHTSKITSSGTHTLAIQVNVDGIETMSQLQQFELNILPPSPVLVSPPSQVILDNISELAETPTALALPVIQPIEVLIEFPDGYPRALSLTRLYINEQLAAENLIPPFEILNWDVTDLPIGEYQIQVEVVDILGLSNLSIETPVEIVIGETTATDVDPSGRSLTIFVTTGIVILAGAIFIFVLVLSVRARSSPRPTSITGRLFKKSDDPVYQSVPETEESTTGRLRLSTWASHLQNRLQWTARGSRSSKPLAYLERLHEPGEAQPFTSQPPFSIHTVETFLGSDPSQANLVIEDDTIDPIHAHIKRERGGKFYLRDHGSIAGTWLNYEQIPAESSGVLLHTGDTIHVGRVALRFLNDLSPLNEAPVIIRHNKKRWK